MKNDHTKRYSILKFNSHADRVFCGHVTRHTVLCCNKCCVVSCKKVFTFNTPFIQTVMQQNVVLQGSRKVDLSSTFRYIVIQVAACDMSMATWNTFGENEQIRARLLLVRDFKQAAGET